MPVLELATRETFSYLIVLCRIGSSFLVMPGIAEQYVSHRIKVVIALTISFLAYRSIGMSMPIPESSINLFLTILSEISIGISFGLVSKILLSSLYIAGHAISSNIGLSSAVIFDHSQEDQGALIGNLLSIIGLVLILSLNLHISIINSLIISYDTLHVGAFFDEFKDFYDLIMNVFITAWKVGMRLTAPFIIMSLVTYLGAGVLSRLMPQLQIFLLLLPAQILTGLLILSMTISLYLHFFIEEYKAFLTDFLN